MNRIASWSKIFRTPWNVVGPLLAVATLSGSALALGPSDTTIALANGSPGVNAPSNDGISPSKKVPRADLSVSMTVSIVRRDSPYRGRVRIRARVKNVGKRAFNSGEHEVLLTLTEKIPGGGAPNAVKSVKIPRLAPGQSKTLNYYMDWSSSTEFPPNYTAYVNHDPDYTLPEANASNNRATRTGAYISSLFR